MTVTRLGQVTAETGSPGEYAKFTNLDSVTLESTIKRTGNYSWNTGTGAGIGLTFPVQTGIRANFASYIQGIALGGALVKIHGNGAYTSALNVQLDTTTLKFYVNSVLLHTADPTVAGYTEGAWNDIGVFYQSGVGGVVSLYINGVLFYSHTATLVGNIDFISTHERAPLLSSFTNAYMDDLYVDALTPDEIDIVPSRKIFIPSEAINEGVVTWTPIGDTPNYRTIDDVGVPDNDGTYVQTLVPDVQDLYVMSPITIPDDYKIRAVIPTAVAKKGDSALDARITPIIDDGVDESVGDSKDVGLIYATAWHRFPTQPNGEAWNEDDYPTMNYGFKASGGF